MAELTEFGELAGGLGLLLLALSMMTSGLRVAAGDRLTQILKKSTTPAWRGLLSGISVTAVAQSSSAVTVATIGFVNAGLMTLQQAVTVVFGTNIGTTATGWMVSFLGFEIKIAVLALPMVGVGMLVKLLYGERSYGGFGIALAGFGLFFLGLDFLRDGFELISPSINFKIVSQFGVFGVLLGVLIGFVVTAIAQSSSVAVALVLTAAAGGAITLPSAAAMVVGANIGTSSTAVLAAIGATANARRVAMAHVIFNLITGVVAVLILIATVPFDEKIATLAAPATLLALFHTCFNVMGVILIWAFRGRLVAFLETQFRTREEDMLKPRYLDKTLIGTPPLAVQAAMQEVARIDGYITTLVAQALDENEADHPELVPTSYAIHVLVEQVYDFVGRVQQTNLAPEVSTQLTTVLKTSQYYLEAAHLALQAKGVRGAIRRLGNPQVRRNCSRYVNLIAPAIERQGLEAAPMVPAIPEDNAKKLDLGYHSLRSDLLSGVMAHEVEPGAVNDFLEILSTLNRLVSRFAKAANVLNEVASESQNGGNETKEEIEVTAQTSKDELTAEAKEANPSPEKDEPDSSEAKKEA